MILIGLIPFLLLGYGLWSHRRGFIWAGAIWIGLAVIYAIVVARRKKA